MTLKRRAETAAPAIVTRIIIRSRPLVFLLVDPLRYVFSEVVAAIVAKYNRRRDVERRV